MKYALVLDSFQDVQKFTEIVQQIDADVRLLGRDENGSPWELSAKSVFCTVLLGTHIQRRHTHPPKNIDWNTIYCECSHDIYHLIRDYVKE